jgi:hypothetical protein
MMATRYMLDNNAIDAMQQTQHYILPMSSKAMVGGTSPENSATMACRILFFSFFFFLNTTIDLIVFKSFQGFFCLLLCIIDDDPCNVH